MPKASHYRLSSDIQHTILNSVRFLHQSGIFDIPQTVCCANHKYSLILAQHIELCQLFIPYLVFLKFFKKIQGNEVVLGTYLLNWKNKFIEP